MKKREEKDTRIKKKIFPASIFIISFLFLAVITTIQMKIIGNYINYKSIPAVGIASVIIFWFLGSIVFTFFISWQIRKKYQEPLEKISDAARKVAEGDFSVYMKPQHTQDKADCLDVLVQDFNKMVEELGSIETLKTDFFSNVSHEFKTPLSVISSNAQMLQRKKLDDKEMEYVDNIVNSSRRMAYLIQNMLKLNKLERQTIKPARERYDLCAQLCECAVQFEESWEKKNIEFNVEIEDSVYISADKGLLELVWNNLFNNAIKFTSEGGSITLSQTSDDKYVRVSVADTGCGMSDEVIGHIFDKFYQGDKSHATFGNGLGLALVKRIVQLSDAEIAVESSPGNGSVFTVTLEKSE
ncbi:HAMP domain-containing histidine kinase [Eubacterium sp. MSJ-13]|uniref:sensor histidine kinase n=1 Tax=Eubacterium sp. MSJ-13 TaxID=2841513 RepID=UPI001C0F86BA|nr:HAMP domain-containing sensor histidine kinase [Eubacterium sp. MSJ-13]MBU5477899.1 HAMP domain-containing histidine kinase [Eubacterium sp. MSJ-13]